MKKLFGSVLVFALALALTPSCVEFMNSSDQGQSQLAPSPVDPDEPVEPDPPGAIGTIELEPRNGEVAVGKNLNVLVIVRDANGEEVPSENITIAIADLTIVRLVEIDGRTIALEGLAVGSTSVIVSASGLQTSMVVAVVPQPA